MTRWLMWVAPALNKTADGSLYFSLRDLIAWEGGIRARAVVSPASWKIAHFHEPVSRRVITIVAMQGALISMKSITQKAVSGE